MTGFEVTKSLLKLIGAESFPKLFKKANNTTSLDVKIGMDNLENRTEYFLTEIQIQYITARIQSQDSRPVFTLSGFEI